LTQWHMSTYCKRVLDVVLLMKESTYEPFVIDTYTYELRGKRKS